MRHQLLALPVLLALGCNGAVSGGAAKTAASTTAPPSTSQPAASPSPPAPIVTTLAGTYSAAFMNALVAAPGGAGARQPDIVYDPRSGVYVMAYAFSISAQNRSALHTIDVSSGSAVVSTATWVEDPAWAAQSNNSDTPSVSAASGNGASRVLVAWTDARAGNGNGHQDIYAQLFEVAKNGVSPVGVNFDVSQSSVNEEVFPNATFEPTSGRWLVSWSDDRNYPALNWQGRYLYARTVGQDGSIGPELQPGDTVAGWQNGATGAAGAGEVFLVWSDYLANPNRAGYRGRMIDVASSKPVGPVIELVRTHDMPVDPPAVAFDDRNGRFLVVWKEVENADVQLYGALVDPSGAIVKPRFALPHQALGAGLPRLAYSHATGSYMVTWHAWQSTDAFVQELDPDGNGAGAPHALAPTPPKLGTFWSTVAAGPGASFLSITNVDYARIECALFLAPRSLP